MLKHIKYRLQQRQLVFSDKIKVPLAHEALEQKVHHQHLHLECFKVPEVEVLEINFYSHQKKSTYDRTQTYQKRLYEWQRNND